jgi:hypothetical protein
MSAPVPGNYGYPLKLQQLLFQHEGDILHFGTTSATGWIFITVARA